jgi:subtilisin family serine protease
MAQFVSFTDLDGLITRLNPADVVSLYPLPSNPLITVVRLNDNSTYLSNQSMAVLQSLFSVSDVIALDVATLAALESITIQNPGGVSAVNIQDGGNSITIDATLLDTRHLTFANDKVDVSGSFVTMDIANASTSSAPAQIVTGAAAIILAANPSRRSFTIQNTGLTVVKIVLGTVNPTTSAYHFALSGGSIADDGKGAFFVDDQWGGEVRAFSDSPSSIVVMELT